jgi:hypothetical protein
MEVLCGLGLLHPVTVLKLVHMASLGLSGADADTRGWHRNAGTRATDAGEDFRPEVSTRYAPEYPIAMKSENSMEWVLFEISLVLNRMKLPFLYDLMKFLFLHRSFRLESLCAGAYFKAAIARKVRFSCST